MRSLTDDLDPIIDPDLDRNRIAVAAMIHLTLDLQTRGHENPITLNTIVASMITAIAMAEPPDSVTMTANALAGMGVTYRLPLTGGNDRAHVAGLLRVGRSYTPIIDAQYTLEDLGYTRTDIGTEMARVAGWQTAIKERGGR